MSQRAPRTRLDRDLSDMLAAEIARGASLAGACRAVGRHRPVNEASVYRWLARAHDGRGTVEQNYLLAALERAARTRAPKIPGGRHAEVNQQDPRLADVHARIDELRSLVADQQARIDVLEQQVAALSSAAHDHRLVDLIDEVAGCVIRLAEVVDGDDRESACGIRGDACALQRRLSTMRGRGDS